MEQILTVTDAAIEKAVMVRSREDEPERHALWVEVVGSGFAQTYDLYLQPLADAPPDALVQDHGRISVVIPAGSIEALRGGTLDRQGDLLMGGLVLNTPQASPDMGPAPEGLEGTAEERVRRVLDEQINPAIAAHGGVAQVERVEDGVVYLRFGGGCAGCGMVSVTLKQGIEAAVLQLVPDVHRIVDVTDHASGTNPYYSPTTA
ncbi:MAG TPA: NifU family protein [Gaiellales bacterium]|jgi:Fe/S biogenesis protein NfuA|nr:NifU family protein [Gaiellales bacterium]